MKNFTKKIPVFLFSIILGQGCAAKKMVVAQADTMLEYQIERRLPLYTNQKKELKADVVAFLNKGKTYAPDILPIVDELNIDHGPKLEVQYHKLMGFFKKLSMDFSKLMAKYIVKLDAKQRREFFENLSDEDRRIGKKDAEERYEEQSDRIELILGTITDKQRELLTKYQPYFNQAEKDRLARRKKLHDKFKDILNHGKGDHQEKQHQLVEAFAAYQDEAFQGATPKYLEILKELQPTLNKNQKEAFRTKVQELKDLIHYFVKVDY